MVDSKMALHPELGCSGSDLALAVRLDDATRDQHVSLGRDGVVKHVIELAQLVAAKAETGRVLTLDP